MRMKSAVMLASALVVAGGAMTASAAGPEVKITPLGSHTGEYCATDRAMLFEDPSGVRILYDAGQSVTGATDPRLGDVQVILLSHAHSDHIGGARATAMDAGSCAKPETTPDPATTTAEIAAAKNAVIVTGNDMGAFVAKKVERIRGSAIEPCAESGNDRQTSVPVAAPCRGFVQLGGKRTIVANGQKKGVSITVVYAEHSNNIARPMLSEGEAKTLADDDLTAYVGHANGYVLGFTNGLKVYLSGDTSITADMKTIVHDFYKPNLIVLNLGGTTMPSEEAAFAVNSLIQPVAVIPSHSSEGATENGKLKPGSRTLEFANLVHGRPVYIPLSGRTMSFDGKATCTSGCK